MVESMCNGEFLDKTVNDTWSFLDDVEKTRQWESIRETEIVSHDIGDPYELEYDSNFDTSMNCMTRRGEALESCINTNVIMPNSYAQSELRVCMSYDSSNQLIENCSRLQNPCYNDDNDDESNFENGVSGPTHATDVEYKPNLEVNEWIEDTATVNREEYAYYSYNEPILEEQVLIEDPILDSHNSEVLDHIVETYIDNVSSNVVFYHNPENFGADTELVQLSCDQDHDKKLSYDLRKDDFSKDTIDLMHENIIDVFVALPRSQSQHDVSLKLSMHENKSFDDDSELGPVNLFNDCEHDTVISVSDLGKFELRSDAFEPEPKYNLDASNSRLKSQTDGRAIDMETVLLGCVKPKLLTLPNLGIDLCASQILLDFLSTKYLVVKMPHLEYPLVSLPSPEHVNLGFGIVQEVTQDLIIVDDCHISVKFRFGRDSFGLTTSLKFLAYYKFFDLQLGPLSLSTTSTDP
ncbi:uncharacterized protein LOC113347887 isoform X2 [Papaver somniferum]|uniref:uncharacterized protein LOC113347887 isoform X2 n=1 Tax=Papaver somniferum TaxID=3469 RepID=UPI000E70487C|nr:uncharacterized protein LOC113347887 isoform X2 [Papaver somniferum]